MKKYFLGFLLLLGNSYAVAENPWIGKQRALVLLLAWADKPTTHEKAEIEKAFFGYGQPSLQQFFAENSAGRFELTGAVMDWKTSRSKWNSANGCDPSSIAYEAWQNFKNTVDIKDYDANGDGRIDHLFVVHSGRIPHDRVGPDCMFGTLNIAEQTAVFQSEGVGSMGSAVPIGFYIHEAGHQLYNFPDLYADHYHGNYGIGMWGMMGLGAWGVSNTISRGDLFRYPSHFEPLSKVEMGWITPRAITQTTRSIKLRPTELTAEIVTIPLADRTTYFLEYRSKQGFSTGHRGHGLLIWKDYEIIQADGRKDLSHGNDLGQRPLPPIAENFGDDSDPFPGSAAVTSFEDTRNGVRIENIVQAGDSIEFDVVLSHVARPSLLLAPKRAGFSGVERL